MHQTNISLELIHLKSRWLIDEDDAEVEFICSIEVTVDISNRGHGVITDYTTSHPCHAEEVGQMRRAIKESVKQKLHLVKVRWNRGVQSKPQT